MMRVLLLIDIIFPCLPRWTMTFKRLNIRLCLSACMCVDVPVRVRVCGVGATDTFYINIMGTRYDRVLKDLYDFIKLD